MAINNPGTNSVYHGVQTQNANSITHGIDVFTSSGPVVFGFYVAEDGADFYVTENGADNYVTEA